METHKLSVTFIGMISYGLSTDTVIRIMTLIRMYPCLYGLEVGKFNLIILTKACAEDNHTCRTISHEVMHIVVDEIEGEFTSLSLDSVNIFGNSILDELTNEGYLGDD